MLFLPLALRPGAPRTRAGTGLALLLAAGCATTGEPKDPSRALEPRDTEIVHEECDLSASGAKSYDANDDGRPELVQVFDGDREVCRAVDFNMDGVIDVFVYFDEQGRERRRESGFDRDTLPDEIAIYEGGVLVRKERETNNDRKIDTWDYYENGKLVREERDSTGDGFVDQWWTFNRPDDSDCAIVSTDGDGDGKPDESSALDICADKPPVKAKAPPELKPEPKPEPKKESDEAEPSDAGSEGDAGTQGAGSEGEGDGASEGADAPEAAPAEEAP